jgi:hypothetical protein
MNKRHVLLAVLKRVGAFKKIHSRRRGITLGEHLANTYDDLKRMGADEEVALAGGLHSIYGTNRFKFQTLKSEQRPVVRELFGGRVERLAWLFCTIDRPSCLETGDVREWKSNSPMEVSPEDLRDLRLVEIANLADNEANLEKYPNLEKFLKEYRESK